MAIPTSLGNLEPGDTTTVSFTTSSLPTSNTAISSAPGPQVTSSSSQDSGVNARQLTSDTTSNSTIGTTTSASSLGRLLPSIAILPDTPNDPIVAIGPYTCSTTINLATFTSQLLDYIQKTETTIDAHLLYVIINIHAASTDSAPLSSAPRAIDLPQSSSLLGNLFATNLTSYLYTPTNLRTDRANIGQSWYRVEERFRPIEDFYTTSTNQCSYMHRSMRFINHLLTRFRWCHLH